MPDTPETPAARTPRHLWVVGGLALAWSATGAVDYVLTQIQHEAYMSSFTPEQRAFFYGFPAWVVSAWAVAVWCGVLGALLLLLRRRLAVWVLLLSFLAMVVTTVHNYVLSNGLEVVGDPVTLGFTALIVLVAAALYVYARAMQRRGVLR